MMIKQIQSASQGSGGGELSTTTQRLHPGGSGLTELIHGRLLLENKLWLDQPQPGQECLILKDLRTR